MTVLINSQKFCPAIKLRILRFLSSRKQETPVCKHFGRDRMCFLRLLRIQCSRCWLAHPFRTSCTRHFQRIFHSVAVLLVELWTLFHVQPVVDPNKARTDPLVVELLDGAPWSCHLSRLSSTSPPPLYPDRKWRLCGQVFVAMCTSNCC